MDDQLVLKNRLKVARAERSLSQGELAKLVGVSRQTISSIETGQFNPTAKLALVLCIALDKKFEELFYFDWNTSPLDCLPWPSSAFPSPFCCSTIMARSGGAAGAAPPAETGIFVTETRKKHRTSESCAFLIYISDSPPPPAGRSGC